MGQKEIISVGLFEKRKKMNKNQGAELFQFVLRFTNSSLLHSITTCSFEKGTAKNSTSRILSND